MVRNQRVMPAWTLFFHNVVTVSETFSETLLSRCRKHRSYVTPERTAEQSVNSVKKVMPSLWLLHNCSGSTTPIHVLEVCVVGHAVLSVVLYIEDFFFKLNKKDIFPTASFQSTMAVPISRDSLSLDKPILSTERPTFGLIATILH